MKVTCCGRVVVAAWPPCSVHLFCDPMDYNLPGSSVHGILQARILEWVVAIPFIQGNLPNPVIKSGLLHCRWILYCLSHQGSPRILEWVVYPFSSGSSQTRNRPGSLALQADSLLTALSGKPKQHLGQVPIKLNKVHLNDITQHPVNKCPLHVHALSHV